MRLVRDFGFSVLMLERGPATTNRADGDAGRLHEVSRPRRLSRDAPDRAAAAARRPRRRSCRWPRRWAAAARSTPWSICAASGGLRRLGGADASATSGRVVLRGHAAALQGARGQRQFNDHYHGTDGNLRVSDPGHICRHHRGFPARRAGRWATPTIPISTARGRTVSASCSTPTAQWGAASARSDAKSAFLDPLAGDDRLTIVTGARVDKSSSRTAGPSASPIRATANRTRCAPSARCWSAPALQHGQAADAVGHRARRPPARVSASVSSPTCRGRPEPAGPPRGAGDRHDQGASPAISARTAAGR